MNTVANLAVILGVILNAIGPVFYHENTITGPTGTVDAEQSSEPLQAPQSPAAPSIPLAELFSAKAADETGVALQPTPGYFRIMINRSG